MTVFLVISGITKVRHLLSGIQTFVLDVVLFHKLYCCILRNVFFHKCYVTLNLFLCSLKVPF